MTISGNTAGKYFLIWLNMEWGGGLQKKSPAETAGLFH